MTLLKNSNPIFLPFLFLERGCESLPPVQLPQVAIVNTICPLADRIH